MPIASTHSATLSCAESPHGIVGRLRRVDLEHGDVGGRVGADDLRAQLALVGHRDRHLDALIDDVVVGEDVAVGRHDHAGAEALRTPFAVAERIVLIVEEKAEERIVRKRRVRRADDLRRRDVRDARDRALRDAGEVGHAARDRRRRGGCARPAAARAGVAALLSPARPHPPGHDEAGKKRDGHEQREDGNSSSHHRTSILRARRRRGFWQRDRQHAVGQVGRDRLGVDLRGELERPRECAVAALDLVEVKASRGSAARSIALAADRQPRILEREIDVFARQAGHFGGDDVAVLGFVDVDRRRPGVGMMAGEPLEPFCQTRRSRMDPTAIRGRSDRRVSRGMAQGCATIECYDPTVLDTRIMASLQATRMKKGMLIKIGQDLFRVLELQHVTPGNLRGFVRVKFRNIRTGALADQKLRSEDFVERATLDEREMQYLYRDGDAFHFMDTATLRAAAHRRRSARRQRQLPDPGRADQGRVLRHRAGRHRAAADGRSRGRGHGARHQGRDRQQPDQAGAPRDRPRRQRAAVREHRRQGPGQHRNGEYLSERSVEC